jgi:hypothetical protein
LIADQCSFSPIYLAGIQNLREAIQQRSFTDGEYEMREADFAILPVHKPDAIIIYDIPQGTHSDKIIMHFEAELKKLGAPTGEVLHVIQSEEPSSTMVVVFSDYKGTFSFTEPSRRSPSLGP